MLRKKNVQPALLEESEQKEQKEQKSKGKTKWLRVELPLPLHKEIRKRAIDADKNVGDFIADVLSKRFGLS